MLGAAALWAGSQAVELATRVPTAHDIRIEIADDLNAANGELKGWAQKGRPLAERREQLIYAHQAAERAERREEDQLNHAGQVAAEMW